MTNRMIRSLPLLEAVVALGAVALWLADARSSVRVAVRVPATRPASETEEAAAPTDLRGVFTKGSGRPAEDIAGAWPAFRGPDGDNVARGGPALARAWPDGGPPVLWRVSLGEGYAGAAVKDGRVYVLDYDEEARADALRCLSLADGEEIWRRSYKVMIKRNHGISRTVPAVGEGVVVALGPKCHVLCCDAQTGDYLWGIDLVQVYGTKVPPWYAGQCPLLDEGRVILAPAGEAALLVALDPRTGEEIWRTENRRRWSMTHASVLPVTIDGVRQYVYVASGGVAGVEAATGRLLWETTEWTVRIAAVPTPVPLGGGRLLFSGGYNSGSLLLRVGREGGRWTSETLWRHDANLFSSEQHTPVVYEDHVYAVIAGRRNQGELVCLSPDGTRRWASGAEHRYGLGPYLIADGLLYLLDDDGWLSLVEPAPEGFRPLARARVLEGPEAWGCLAVAGGRLLARDLHEMVCLDVRKEIDPDE